MRQTHCAAVQRGGADFMQKGSSLGQAGSSGDASVSLSQLGSQQLNSLQTSSQLSRGSRADKRPSLFTAFPDIKPTAKHDKIIDAFGAAATMNRASSAPQCLML